MIVETMGAGVVDLRVARGHRGKPRKAQTLGQAQDRSRDRRWCRPERCGGESGDRTPFRAASCSGLAE